MINEQE